MKAKIWALLSVLWLAAACSRNPATRKVQAFLPDESEEVALGAEVDLQLRETIDLYDDAEALSSFVGRVGRRVASTTERPELPWAFYVIDDPDPNAFAVPGGGIYVTRGLLAHLGSEAELAAVVAHESGHIAARHGVRRLQRLTRMQHRHGRSSTEMFAQQMDRLGSRSVARFLERSREEELEADDLALRYLARANYPQIALASALKTLGSSHAPGLEPSITHPTTVYRRARIHSALSRDEGASSQDATYLGAVDGLAYGPDPNEGYYKDGAFVHPRLGFVMPLPKHWTVEYRGGRAVAKNPAGDTLLVVEESRVESVRAGMNGVFANNVGKRDPWSGTVAGGPAAMAEFSTVRDDAETFAFVGFVEFDGKIVEALAFSSSAQWPAEDIRKVLRQLRPATPAQRRVEPMRLGIVELRESMTLQAFHERFPSAVPLSVMARLNAVAPGEVLPEGHRVKRVTGFNPDFAGQR